MNGKRACLVISILWWVSGPAWATELPPVATAEVVEKKDVEKSCAQLDRTIGELTLLTYSHSPSFFRDPLNAVALVPGSLAPVPAYFYSIYSATSGARAAWRTAPTHQRIRVLRKLKAQNRCFEEP